MIVALPGLFSYLFLRKFDYVEVTETIRNSIPMKMNF